jgi:alkanesulfonate monooxygenase SsuD/methylene tetrahydromethanopterin reductase-like flavin-dependent oxidoreductase (luciferase family)
MAPNPNVLFGRGLDAGVDQVSEMLGHARFADDADLDLVRVGDHPYFAERLDAYAVLGFVLGATSNITGAVIMTNLLSWPPPVLARTVTGLSTLSGGRVVLGMGAGGLWDEIVALGVPRLTPAARNTSARRGNHGRESAIRWRGSGSPSTASSTRSPR